MHTILVLEDDKLFQAVIHKKFDDFGWTMLPARSVVQAREYLANFPEIDAIWVDHFLLGNGDGLQFVSELKGNAAWKNLPVFVVSGSNDPNQEQSYIQLGVEKYYTKSEHRLDELIDDIKRVLDAPSFVA